MADPLQDLGPLLGRRREKLGLSLREAAEASGVPPATIARVEQGRMPDLTTFRKLVHWLGLPPEQFFGETQHTTSTPDVLIEHLRDDPTLSPDALEQMEQVIRNMYDALVTQERRVAVHLRAAKTFTPAAQGLLAELLEDMQAALEQQEPR